MAWLIEHAQTIVIRGAGSATDADGGGLAKT